MSLDPITNPNSNDEIISFSSIYQDFIFISDYANENKDTYFFLIIEIYISILNKMESINKKLYNNSTVNDFMNILNSDQELYHLLINAFNELNYNFNDFFYVLYLFPIVKVYQYLVNQSSITQSPIEIIKKKFNNLIEINNNKHKLIGFEEDITNALLNIKNKFFCYLIDGNLNENPQDQKKKRI